MSASRKDRIQIESLHEMPVESNGPLLASSSSSKWDSPPVTIVPPSNAPRLRARVSTYDSHMHFTNSRNPDVYNPFGGRRMKTTLTSVNQTLGKRISGMDLQSLRTTSPPAYARKKVKTNKKKILPPESEIIDVDTERRDTSSPDPLSEFVPTNGPVADDMQSSSSCTVTSTPRLRPDGRATKNLKRVLQDTRASSPIEEFEDDKRKQSIVLEPLGNVQRLVSQIENRKLEDGRKVPIIDLRSKIVPLKNKMKPKNPLDPVATSSSNFTQRGYLLKVNEDFNLPIKAYVIDDKLISKDTTTEPMLTWNASEHNLTLSCKPDKAVVTLNTRNIVCLEHAESTTPSPHFDGMPVLTIHLARIQPTTKLPQGPASIHPKSSLVTIMLDSSTAKWSTGLCDSFLNWLKSQSVSIRSSRNGQQMWEMAVRDLNATNQGQDSGYVQEDKSHPTPRVSDIHPTSEAKSESNELEEPSTEKSDTASDQAFQPRRSSRNATVTIKKPKLPVDPDEVILVYPQGLPGAINITNADVSRLQPGEFLNDTVIEFALKLWHKELESLNPEFAKDVHVFSSFFYKKLNKRNFEEGYQSVRKWTSKINLFDKKYIIVPINEHLHWYLAIIYMPHYILQPPPIPIKPSPSSCTRSRTSKVANEAESLNNPTNVNLSAAMPSVTGTEDQFKNDLDEFQKSCTITVAEEHSISDVMDVVTSHPEGHDDGDRPLRLTDECAMDVDKSEEDAVQEQLRAASIFSDDAPLNVNDIEVETEISSEQVSSRFFSDNAMKFVIELDSQGQRTAGKAASMSERWQEDIQEEVDDQAPENNDEQGDEAGFFPSTYIFTLDSLGTRHVQATRQLNRYLKMEASHKLNTFNTSEAICKAVPVPAQPNYCDCGIYLLHFVRTFMTDPTKYFQTIIASKKSPTASDRKAIWKDHKIGTMRQELTERIRELSEEWKKTRQEARRDQGGTVSDTDSEIEYVETAPASIPAKAKMPRRDSKRYKAGKSSRLRR